MLLYFIFDNNIPLCQNADYGTKYITFTDRG